MSRVTRRLRTSDAVLFCVVCAITLLVMQSAYRQPRHVSYTMDAPESVLPSRHIHPLERFPHTGDPFRWTNGGSVVRLPNPGGIATVTLFAGGSDAGVVPIDLDAGATSLRFATRPELRAYHVFLSASGGGRVVLELVSSTIAVPTRHVGVMLTNVAIQGGGQAPMAPLLWVLISVTLLYSVLRRLYGYRVVAGAGALLPPIALHGWLVANGWEYALLGPWLVLAGSAAIVCSLALCRRGLHANIYVVAGFGLLCATSISFALLYVGMPEYREAIFDEDRLVEYLTALCFLLSVCISLFGIVARGRQHWKLYGVVASVGAIAFLDEMSFGERLFRWKMPYINGVKLDGMHDFASITYETLHALPGRYMLGIALVSAAIAVCVVYGLWRLLQTLLVNRMQLIAISGSAFCFFVAVAVVIDLEIVWIPILVTLFEEVSELNAALALCLTALAVPYRGRMQWRSAQHAPSAVVIPTAYEPHLQAHSEHGTRVSGHV